MIIGEGEIVLSHLANTVSGEGFQDVPTLSMYFSRALGTNFVRTASTLVVRTGRVYVRDRVLQIDPRNPELNIHLVQKVSSSILNLCPNVRLIRRDKFIQLREPTFCLEAHISVNIRVLTGAQI